MALGTVTIENARIIFRNFAGREGQYNREGDRNFGVILDPELAEQMLADGWNVKYLKPREGEEEEPTPWVQVSVNYRGRPPRVVMVTSRGRTSIPEDMVEVLDWADLKIVDLILNPYEWAVNGNTGVKAYLKSLFVTILKDELEQKYADVPEIDMSGRPLEITDGRDEEIVEGEVVE